MSLIVINTRVFKGTLLRLLTRYECEHSSPLVYASLLAIYAASIGFRLPPMLAFQRTLERRSFHERRFPPIRATWNVRDGWLTLENDVVSGAAMLLLVTVAAEVSGHPHNRWNAS